jgi:hypothetical protein
LNSRFLTKMKTKSDPVLGVAAKLAGPFMLCLIAIAQLWPGLSQGLSPPISWDHGAHLGKAIQTAHELLPFLRGWTDNVELGVPLNTFYAPSGTIFILLVRAFTFWLDWIQTYAIAIAAFRCLVALSVYRLARVAGAARVAAFLAGVILLADAGDHSEGGWFYDVLYGVWPMELGVTIFFFSLADLIRFLERGKRTDGARAMLLLGIALFSHQMVLIGSLTILPMLLFGRWLDIGKLKEPAFRIASVFSVAMLISAWWLFPLLAQTRWLDDHGQLYITYKELGTRAMSGSIAPNMGPFTGVLVVVSLVAAFFSRGARRALAIATALMLVLSARDWLTGIDSIGWLPSLGRIMYPRFMMLAKPMAFVLVGLLLSDLIERARAELREQRRAAVVVSSVALIAFVLPFSAGLWAKSKELLIARDVPTTASRPGFSDYLAYADWMRAQPHEPFFRVAYSDTTSHIFQSAAALTNHPAHKMGMLIAEAFGNVSDSNSAQALRDMNVRYLVFWGSPDGRLVRESQRVRAFGPLSVYELNGWDSRIAVDVAGHATPTITARGHERLVIDPHGATDLLVRRAAGPGWRASADGRAIAITEQRLASAPELRVMRLHLPAGTRSVELTYRTLDALGIFAALLTFVGVALAALFAFGILQRRWERALARAKWVALVERFEASKWSGLRIAFLAVGLLLLIALVVALTRPYRLTPASRAAHLELVHEGNTQQCTEARDEGGHACAGQSWLAVGPTLMAVEGRLRSCTWAHPPPEGDVMRATFEHVPLTRSLRFGAGISDEVGSLRETGVISLRVLSSGRELGRVDVPDSGLWIERSFPTQRGEHDVTVELTTRGSNAQHWLCFDAIAE